LIDELHPTVSPQQDNSTMYRNNAGCVSVGCCGALVCYMLSRSHNRPTLLLLVQLHHMLYRKVFPSGACGCLRALCGAFLSIPVVAAGTQCTGTAGVANWDYCTALACHPAATGAGRVAMYRLWAESGQMCVCLHRNKHLQHAFPAALCAKLHSLQELHRLVCLQSLLVCCVDMLSAGGVLRQAPLLVHMPPCWTQGGLTCPPSSWQTLTAISWMLMV
jgi:hypothetical protein